MAASRALSFLTVKPATQHTATVIFLHGLGDSGHGWEPVAKMLAKNPKLSHIKWILPNAPKQPVTLNYGMSMPSWFDIRSLDKDLTADDGGEDADGMLSSAMKVNALVTTQVDDENIPANRIVVGGFSQGAALSLLTGLTSERRLAGLVCLSGWLPLSGKMKSVSFFLGKCQ
jgi:predicted esterase